MKKTILILTLMVAALCGCAAQQPTTLETPETSVLVEVTPETGSEAAPTSTPHAGANSRAHGNTGSHRSPDCGTYPSPYRGSCDNCCSCAADGSISAGQYELWCRSL